MLARHRIATIPFMPAIAAGIEAWAAAGTVTQNLDPRGGS